MTGTSRRLARLVVLLLAATAGLLAAGGYGLWRSARDSEALARGAAERAVFSAARALQLHFADPEALPTDPLDPARFELVDGVLRWPESTQPWPLDSLDPDLDLAALLLAPLDEADAAVAQGDAAAATAALDRAIELARQQPARQLAYVLNSAAWTAARAGDGTRRDALLNELLALLPPHPIEGPPPYASVFAGALLLALAHAPDAPLLAAPDAALASLQPSVRVALLARAVETTSPHAPFAVAAARVEQREQLSTRITSQLARLSERRAPLVEPCAEGWLLYQPDPARAGRGRGAWRSLAELLPSARANANGFDLDDATLAPGGAVRLVVGEPLPAAAMPIASGLGLLPRPLPAPGFFASTGALATTLVVLGGALVAALWLVLRTVQRESATITARGRFLTSVTHELKTPLASIRLLSELLVEGRATIEKQDEYHRLLAGEAERLSALIENVLDVASLERSERALAIAPQRVDLLLRDVVQRVSPLLERDGLTVTLELPEEPLELAVDRGALSQIVINLLDNARKYATAGGSVVVTLAPPPPASLHGRVAVRVRDRGPGIAPADRESLFEPFVRGAAQGDGATPGLGLGLHLARTLARRHGGELACMAPPDGGPGACFELTLPVDRGGGA